MQSTSCPSCSLHSNKVARYPHGAGIRGSHASHWIIGKVCPCWHRGQCHCECVLCVSQAKLVEGIAKLVEDKVLEGVADIKDESDRTVGVRVVVEVGAGATQHGRR